MSTQAIAQKTLLQTQVNNELNKRLQSQETEKQAAAEKRPALIKAAVDALIENERIYEDQREPVTAALADHNKALEMLEKLAVHRNAAEVEQIGQEVPGTGTTKTAGQRYVGEPVVDHDERESGRIFRERIMHGAQ